MRKALLPLHLSFAVWLQHMITEVNANKRLHSTVRGTIPPRALKISFLNNEENKLAWNLEKQ